MRIWISAMLLASTAALGAPALAQDQPQGHDGHNGGGEHAGDHHGGGGDHRGGQPQGQPAAQAPQQRPPQAAQPNPGQPNRAPQPGRDDPRFRGGQGVQGGQGYPGGRGPGFDPRQGHAGGDPVNRPGWNNGARGNDGRDRDRPVFQDGRPGFDDHGGRPGGYDNRGPGGRPGGYDRGPGGGDRSGNWNRGWRNDNRYDWQGYRNAHRDIFRGGGYRAPYGYGYGYRRFGIGAAIAPAYFAQDYWIADPSYYRLPPAYGPYRWVRYYNDALLIDLRSGVVVDAIPGFFF